MTSGFSGKPRTTGYRRYLCACPFWMGSRSTATRDAGVDFHALLPLTDHEPKPSISSLITLQLHQCNRRETKSDPAAVDYLRPGNPPHAPDFLLAFAASWAACSCGDSNKAAQQQGRCSNEHVLSGVYICSCVLQLPGLCRCATLHAMHCCGSSTRHAMRAAVFDSHKSAQVSS